MMARLDDKDLEIVRVLKEDARTSIREISLKTGIKPSTIHQRIRKLIDDGVIEKFTLKLNKEYLGEAVTVLVFISTDSVLKGFDYPNIKEVHRISGEYDYLLKMSFSDLDSFNRFFTEFRKGKVIKRSESIVVTSTIKDG